MGSSVGLEIPGLIFRIAGRKCSAMSVCHAIIGEAMGDITHTVCQGSLCGVEDLQILGSEWSSNKGKLVGKTNDCDPDKVVVGFQIPEAHSPYSSICSE
jgi:hypothetical protein